jgi:oligopeptide/dipeptide ABC transporter ATP-binding protein
MGLVGESGCGKTMTALSIIGLTPKKISRIVGGEIVLDGDDLTCFKEKELRDIRGKKIGMIFQDPMTSLNPTLSVKEQISETIIAHKKIRKKDAVDKALQLLKTVEIPSPQKVLNYYPYQLSGGMRQRVVIAIAISCDPIILIADEPTTALDLTIQKQILELLKKLQKELNTTMIIISHDLNVIGELCDNVSVMYAGKIVEKAKVTDIFKNPKHPYTIALFKCIPRVDYELLEKLVNIKGAPPDFTDLPQGCRFNPRCDHAKKMCMVEEPGLIEVGLKGHRVSCFNPLDTVIHGI